MRLPIEPMRAASVTGLPDPRGRRLVYEPKWDGWRCLAQIGTDRVVLFSRQGRDLTRYFPDIAGHLAHLPPGVVVDGELIVWDTDQARTSFPALQRRVSAGRRLAREAAEHSAHFVVFDLLADAGGQMLLDQPLARRRARLETLLASAPPHLQVCPQTADADLARRWMHEWADAGVEGLVIKELAGRYTPGRAGWSKFKTRVTTEAVIGGVTGHPTDPHVLLLGRLNPAGRLRYVAQTHPLAAVHRRELAELLHPLTCHGPVVGHPWPQPLPAGWSSQLGDRQPLPYIQVRPVVVVEVVVDTAYDADHGRWRHRVRYLRNRDDLNVGDLSHWPPNSPSRPARPNSPGSSAAA